MNPRILHTFPVAMLVAAGLAGLPTSVPSAAAATECESLPSVTSGARPGPDILYEPRPDEPQLQNHHPAFRAPMTLVSNSERYVEGEYLFQDQLNDDWGPSTNGDTSTQFKEGDMLYPTDEDRYGNNAADLVEVRVSDFDGGHAIRFSLNTMRAVDDTVISLLFDHDQDIATGMDALPRDPGMVVAGTDQVITTWGSGAEISTADGADITTVALEVTADLDAQQITVIVPAGTLPRIGTANWAALAGLWDGTTWIQPGGDAATTPSTEDDPVNAVFDAAPTFDEDALSAEVPGDRKQATRLGTNTLTDVWHPMDLGMIADGGSLDLVPKDGFMFRIFPSRLDLGGGRAANVGTVTFRQDLQEYGAFIPTAVGRGIPVGFTTYLHSNERFHWGYSDSPFMQWNGEDRDSIVVTPLGRGGTGFYQGEMEADVWEVYADVAYHFCLDPDYVVATGTSMGGYGTYRLATLYPDLFVKAWTNIGPPINGIWVPPVPGDLQSLTNLFLDNVRNVPFLNQVTATDELVPITGTRAQNIGAPELDIRGFEQLGYRYRFLVYSPGDHITISLSYDPLVSEWLGGREHVDRDPFHVTYRVIPDAERPDLRMVRDHAYWVSGITVADDAPPAPAGAAISAAQEVPRSGLIDVVSHAFGLEDPVATGYVDGYVSTVVAKDPLPTTTLLVAEQGIRWDDPAQVPPRNAATVALTGVTSLRIDLPRARLVTSEDLILETTSDRAAEVVLSGAQNMTAPGATATADALTVPVPEGAATITVTRMSGSNQVDPVPSTPSDAVDVMIPGGPEAVAPLPATGGSAAPLGLVLLCLALVARRRGNLRGLVRERSGAA